MQCSKHYDNTIVFSVLVCVCSINVGVGNFVKVRGNMWRFDEDKWCDTLYSITLLTIHSRRPTRGERQFFADCHVSQVTEGRGGGLWCWSSLLMYQRQRSGLWLRSHWVSSVPSGPLSAPHQIRPNTAAHWRSVKRTWNYSFIPSNPGQTVYVLKI